MAEQLGDQPVEEKYRQQMRELAQALDELINQGKKGAERTTGFCLMMFDFGEGPGRCNYISNCERSSVIQLLKEQIKRFEGKQL